MKYLKALAVFFVIILTGYFNSVLDFIHSNYLFSTLSISIILTIGTWFFQNLIISSIEDIKTECKKLTYKIDVILILSSSITLYFLNFDTLIIIWIIVLGLTLMIGIPYFIAIWKLNK